MAEIHQAVQMQFLSAVESLNPDEIMRILNSHPLHIDSMLQLSEICKMGEDSAMATELIGDLFSTSNTGKNVECKLYLYIFFFYRKNTLCPGVLLPCLFQPGHRQLPSRLQVKTPPSVVEPVQS